MYDIEFCMYATIDNDIFMSLAENPPSDTRLKYTYYTCIGGCDINDALCKVLPNTLKPYKVTIRLYKTEHPELLSAYIWSYDGVYTAAVSSTYPRRHEGSHTDIVLPDEVIEELPRLSIWSMTPLCQRMPGCTG